jgi:hypothetical protein
MRDERARTKLAELNTAPLPELKIGLSEDSVQYSTSSIDWLRLTSLAFHNAHGRDGRIHRLTTGAKNCVSSL